MICADQTLKNAFLTGSAEVAGDRSDSCDPSASKDSEDEFPKINNHLFYLGKIDLPNHPVRVRILPRTAKRLVLYGTEGCQEISINPGPHFYTLNKVYRLLKMTDCVQIYDGDLVAVTRSHYSALLIHYNRQMEPQNAAEITYPSGCLSSITTDCESKYIYGTNLELNCIIRFTPQDLSTLSNSQRFGTLWRPFDSCTSQPFENLAGGLVQYLFVSNLDAGICAFNMETMEVVLECGDDLLPGTKYLAYDPRRNLLFVSCSCERLLRCYKFIVPASLAQWSPTKGSSVAGLDSETAASPLPAGEASNEAQPRLQRVGDFLMASRKPSVRFSGPQCIMWDPMTEQLMVNSWSPVKGVFSGKMFKVNI